MTTADGTVTGTTQISGSAPRNRAFNIVLLGDGFQAAQQGTFNSACTAFVTALLGTPPFNDLAPAINVFRVNVTSTDSGADDPTSAGGTGATARTYFDATFGGNGIRRLLLCNTTTVLTVAAAQVPEFTLALLVVNSTVYGGAGGSVGTFSLATGANEIAIHEAGHTAFGLADEYPYYAGGSEPGHDHHPATEPSEPNVTINSNRATLKWRWAVAASTAIPTMSNPDCSTVDSRPSPVPAGTVGAFEGAHYYHCGAFRPEFDCKMRNLGVPFCAVCRAVIWNRIFPLTTLDARRRTPISVVARYPEHLDVFAVDSAGRTVSDWWSPSTGWAGWFHLSGGIASPGGPGSPVTAVSRYAGHLDVFTVGTDNRVYSAWWDVSTGWSSWFVLAGGLVARPGSTVNVVSRYTGHLDVFTIANDGRIMSCWWDAASGWSGWFHVSGGIAANGAQVTAIARYPFHLDLFVVGTDNKVYSCWWDERSGWAGWFRVGDQSARADATVNVVARHRDQLDLFTTDPSGRIVSTWWNVRGGWGTWFQVSGGVASPGSQVTAIARYSNHLDLFTVGTDNRIYSTWWHDTTGWAGWFVVSGGVASPGSTVTAISRYAEHIDVFAVGSDGKAYSTWWDGSTGWAGWFQLAVT
ncbi:M64 family metallopeptidase [Sinomonas mesophila]|uniref:M64 family metallopeptidase n=1 Tax=Sinomonas mesophila TaxID=1531955 RepID=UPI000984B514|nr:M64 family metallopeptidase [Sinomonas mesophila]